MWFFPFKNYYLKTAINRAQIHQKILDLTFLSDAGYRRQDNSKKYFYGTVSDELFSLQTINDENRLVPYIEGDVKGVGNEMVVFLQFKAFRHRRLYVLLFLFAIAGILITGAQLLQNGLGSFRNAPFLLLGLVILSVCIYLVRTYQTFWRVQKNSLDFFRGLLDAEPIPYAEVPIVFKL